MIEFKTGITPEAVEFVKDNLNRIGELVKITHERNRRDVYYQTAFVGTKDTIILVGGLSSGFDGSGPNALYQLLVELGVPEDEAKREIYDSKENSSWFEIEMKLCLDS